MSAGRGPARELAEVLAGHRLAGLNGYCSCGWASDLRDRDRLKQHDAHLADVALAWVAEESGLARLARMAAQQGDTYWLRQLRAALAALVGYDGREGAQEAAGGPLSGLEGASGPDHRGEGLWGSDRLCEQCGMPLYRCETKWEGHCCDGCDHA